MKKMTKKDKKVWFVRGMALVLAGITIFGILATAFMT